MVGRWERIPLPSLRHHISARLSGRQFSISTECEYLKNYGGKRASAGTSTSFDHSRSFCLTSEPGKYSLTAHAPGFAVHVSHLMVGIDKADTAPTIRQTGGRAGAHNAGWGNGCARALKHVSNKHQSKP